jgi:AcrR family transcriptional regulator
MTFHYGTRFQIGQLGMSFHLCEDVGMAEKRPNIRRRKVALSRTQVVEAAVALLDQHGEAGLTFKALAERLATGAGAIYGHIANKADLIAAACDPIVAEVQQGRAAGGKPQESIREFALGMFDAIDAHPWVGTALTRIPGQSPLLRILDAIGQDIRALAVPATREWASTMAVFNYIIGVGGQNAANAQLARSRQWERAEVLEALARTWADLDPSKYPFASSIGSQLQTHDDRAVFLAGIDFIIAGITASTAS